MINRYNQEKKEKRNVDLLSWALVYSSFRAFSYQFVSNVKWKESDPCNVPKNVIQEMPECSFWWWCSAPAWFGIWIITLLRVGVVVPLRIHFCAPSTVVLRSSVLLARIYIFSMTRIQGQLILYMKIEVSIKSKPTLYELWTKKEYFPLFW
jgi:hypothetical protein